MRWQLLLMSAFFAALPVSGHAAEINCPKSITETPNVSSSEKSWLLVSKSGVRHLESANIYYGNPTELGADIPDSTDKTRSREIVTWLLFWNKAKTEGYWIGCSYDGTTAMYFQKVNPDSKECVVSYDLLPTGRRQRLSAIVCR